MLQAKGKFKSLNGNKVVTYQIAEFVYIQKSNEKSSNLLSISDSLHSKLKSCPGLLGIISPGTFGAYLLKVLWPVFPPTSMF